MAAPKDVLVNTDLKELKRFGYAVTQGLPLDKVYDLYRLANTQNTEISVGGLHTTHFSEAPDNKKKISQHIINLLGKLPQLNDLQLEPVFGNFMIKPVDPHKTVVLHADWTYVDEQSLRGYNLWIPLHDTTLANGALHIVPFSHKVFDVLRGPFIPHPFESYSAKIVALDCVPLCLKKGQAVIFDNALLHYSPPNKTTNPRYAVSLMLLDNEADWIHYTFDMAAQKIRKY